MISKDFYQLCEQSLGLNAGQSFHDNYSGILIRPITKNASLTDEFEELRKGRFAFLKDLWDSLTPTELLTFTTVAGTFDAAMQLFLEANINLILSGNSTITSYPGTSSPGSFAVSITSITNASFLMKASGGTPTVPTDHSLLILATACKDATKIFTDPPQYSPIISFPAGTDLSADTDIITNWKAYFGETSLSKKICIKAVLIDTTNGARGSASFACQVVTAPIVPFYQGIDFRGTAGFVTDPAGHDYEISKAVNYPRVTPQGYTVGWTSRPTNAANNCSTTVPELAGSIVTFNAQPNAVYRIDLPHTGIFKIRIAVGSCFVMAPSFSLWDDTTLITSISKPIVFGNTFVDASGTVRTRALWQSDNTQISYNFTSTIFLLKLGPSTPNGDNSAISCIIIED